MYNLFLDDIRKPEDVTLYKENKSEWIIVKDYNEFVKCVEENGLPKMVSFDHDLAFDHYAAVGKNLKFKTKTGYDALTWFCEYIEHNNFEMPEIKFHSSNFVGIKNMKTYLGKFNERYEPRKN